MKIEKISDTDYKIYVFSYDKDFDCIIECVRNIISKIQKRLKLNGFYKVIVYHRKIGLFLKLVKMDNSFYSDTLDLKIVIDDESNLYFKTRDYFILKELDVIKYYDNFFYGLVDDSFDNILESVEFGNFIFGEDTFFIDNGIVI